jgi:hypothetical protein
MRNHTSPPWLDFFIGAIALSIATISLSTSASDGTLSLTHAENKFPCLTTLNLGECALGFERQFLDSHADIVVRNEAGLRVKLFDGRWFEVSDTVRLQQPLELQADKRFLVIREQLEFGNTWHLLDRQSGTLIRNVDAYPLFSPDKKNVVLAGGDDAVPGILAIHSVEAGRLVEKFSAKFGRISWWPNEVKWRDNSTVLFTLSIIEVTSSGTKETISRAALVMRDGAWTIEKRD